MKTRYLHWNYIRTVSNEKRRKKVQDFTIIYMPSGNKLKCFKGFFKIRSKFQQNFQKTQWPIILYPNMLPSETLNKKAEYFGKEKE